MTYNQAVGEHSECGRGTLGRAVTDGRLQSQTPRWRRHSLKADLPHGNLLGNGVLEVMGVIG